MNVIGVATLALVLFAATLAPASAAMSIRGTSATSAVTEGRTARTSSTGQYASPVVGEPVMETPDPNLPLNAERPAPVIGEPAMETPDPNQPQDVNTSSRSVRR
jgi:hypothetical protein